LLNPVLFSAEVASRPFDRLRARGGCSGHRALGPAVTRFMLRCVQFLVPRSKRTLVALLLPLIFILGGCDRLNLRNDSKKQLQLGADRLAARDFRGAVAAYEESLDGTPKTAEAHFRLALIYYDHLQDPVGAIHHFRRYLEVAGDGPFAKQARANITRAELTLSAGLSGGTLVSRGEATRIRSENLQLKQQLAIAKATSPANPKSGAKPPAAEASEVATGQRAATAAVKEAERKAKAETRTYKVQPGDTLQGISRKFYQTPNRAPDILDANINQLPDESKLKAGMTLIIP
jgi:LysM repeat protein